jgi:hypothetical protein
MDDENEKLCKGCINFPVCGFATGEVKTCDSYAEKGDDE